jgi:hypothetical protein
MFDWIDLLLFFVGGFGFGYGLASRSERKRINTIIGHFDRIDKAEERLKNKTPLILACLLLVSGSAVGQQFNGTISPSGYTPPDSVWVQWCRAGDNPQCRSFQLNPSIPWDGQSAEGKFGRYSGGDRSTQGFSSVPAVSGEAKGGEIGAALIKLLGHQYTEMELWDFAFANPCNGFLCGCGWYERVTGSRHPIDPGCVNESKGGDDNLRPCPNEPVGCGRSRNNPCVTADTDIPTDRAKQVACFSGNGRVGRWLKRIEIEIDKPIEPTPTPIEPRPVDPLPPQPNLICLVLKIDPTTKAYTIEVCK